MTSLPSEENKDENEISLEKLKIYIGFAKFFSTLVCGTIFTSLLSFFINYKEVEIKARESELQLQLNEREELARYFRYTMEGDVYDRLNLSKFFGSVLTDPDARELWNDYHKTQEELLKKYLDSSINYQQIKANSDKLDQTESLTRILFEIETLQKLISPINIEIQKNDSRSIENISGAITGSSELTATINKLSVVGVPASFQLAMNDQARIIKIKENLEKVAKKYNLPPALLAAIASRESRGGAILNQDGLADYGNAFGIMQLDRRYHKVNIEDGPTGQAHIEQATGILANYLRQIKRKFPELSPAKQLQGAVVAYNSGVGNVQLPISDEGTTGDDYSNDVWARARYYAENIKWNGNNSILFDIPLDN
ncbi:MAG TPA: hypothetical protein DCF68_22590 [Cyanothece sp. UBA12306]|nr:hypothetical protein [Cyanothece sp. UBA12306]